MPAELQVLDFVAGEEIGIRGGCRRVGAAGHDGPG